MKEVSNCPFLFLTPSAFSEPSDAIVVAKKEWFEKMSIGNTYGNYGKAIDTDECGDYEVVAYNYHNGSNWQSIIIQSDCDEDIDFEVITDEELILKYWQAIDDKSYDREEKGIQYYESDGFEITKSNWQGTWSLYKIEEK